MRGLLCLCRLVGFICDCYDRPLPSLPPRFFRGRYRAGTRHRAADDGPAQEPRQSRLPVLRPARLRQDHLRPHPGPLPELRPGPHRHPVRHAAPAASSWPAAARDPSTSSRSTPPATAASTTPATCANAPRSPPSATATRSSSSTRPTWSPPPASTPCSRSSRSRRSTSSSSSRPPSRTRSSAPSAPARTTTRSGWCRRSRSWRTSRRCARRRTSPWRPGVLSLVIRAGGGSVRDSLSVLDQLMAGAGPDGLDYELAVALLGYTHASLLDDVVEAVAASDAATVFRRGGPRHPDRARPPPFRGGPARALPRPHHRPGHAGERAVDPPRAARGPDRAAAEPGPQSRRGRAVPRGGRHQHGPDRNDGRHVAAAASGAALRPHPAAFLRADRARHCRPDRQGGTPPELRRERRRGSRRSARCPGDRPGRRCPCRRGCACHGTAGTCSCSHSSRRSGPRSLRGRRGPCARIRTGQGTTHAAARQHRRLARRRVRSGQPPGLREGPDTAGVRAGAAGSGTIGTSCSRTGRNGSVGTSPIRAGTEPAGSCGPVTRAHCGLRTRTRRRSPPPCLAGDPADADKNQAEHLGPRRAECPGGPLRRPCPDARLHHFRTCRRVRPGGSLREPAAGDPQDHRHRMPDQCGGERKQQRSEL